MLLHDWTADDGWYGVQKIWMFEMLKWVFPLLPAEYRVYFREEYFSFDEGVEDIDLALQIEAAQGRVIASIMRHSAEGQAPADCSRTVF